MEDCVVLLSGGMDSVVSLALARSTAVPQVALTFNYGQQAVNNEVFAAQRICSYYNIKHEIIDLPWLGRIDTSSLQSRRKIPQIEITDLDNDDRVKETGSAVWVPNRNGVFLNIAACYAESINAAYIIAGFNKEEAETFSDNSEQFVDSINKALLFSTKNHVKVLAPTLNLKKKEIAATGFRLGIPWKYLWSCYEGGKQMCGRCESCQRLRRALREAEIDAPILFER